MDKISNAQVIYNWISNAIDEKRDLTSDTLRKTDFANLCATEKTRTFSKSHYINIFHKVLKDKNLDPRSYGLSRAVPSFKKTQSSDMEGETRPSPAKIKIKNSVSPPLIPENAKSDSDFVQEEISNIDLKFNRANVGATIKGFYMFIQWKYPFLDNLTEDEKNDLADLWLPAFEKYVKGKYTIIAIPAMATIGILKGKVNKERKAKYDHNKLQKKKGQVAENEQEELK